jgi:tetratricopeptide (TPR) repeat protein
LSLSKELTDFLEQKFVLVIEPNMNYRIAIKSFFAKLKLDKIKFVGSVAEAKREMLTNKFGLFVVEWRLPEKNGLQFCRELRKERRYKHTPFLLLSTENLREDIILASECGISSYLVKPFSFQDFCARIRVILTNEKNPTQLQSLLDRADAYCEKHEYWVAEALYREALTIRPSSARATCGLGRIELANKNTQQALGYFNEAVTANPEYVDGYKYILQIAEDKSDHEGILNIAIILHSVSPDNPRYPLLIAAAQLEAGNFIASEEFFRKTVRLSPKLAAGYKGLGQLYLKTKEYEKAMRNLQKALDLEQGDVSTLNSLGLAYVRQNLVDDGIKKYQLALSIDPNDSRVLFNLGLAMELKDNLVAAREHLLRAIATDSGFEKAKRNIIRIDKLISAKTGTYQPPGSTLSEYSISLNKRGA